MGNDGVARMGFCRFASTRRCSRLCRLCSAVEPRLLCSGWKRMRGSGNIQGKVMKPGNARSSKREKHRQVDE